MASLDLGRIQIDEDGATGRKAELEDEGEDCEEYYDANEHMKEQEAFSERGDSPVQKNFKVREEYKGHKTVKAQAEPQDFHTDDTAIEANNTQEEPASEHPSRALNSSYEPRSYAAARNACIRSFIAVVMQYQRNNEKFTDPEFELQRDARGTLDFLYGLLKPLRLREGDNKSDWDKARLFPAPEYVHRIGKVVEGAQFAEGSGKSNVERVRRELEGDGGRANMGWVNGTVLKLTIRSLLAIGLFAQSLAFARDFVTRAWTSVAALAFAALLHFRHPNRCHDRPIFSSSEIKQSGALRNCWFLSAVASLAGNAKLLQSVCVAWDQDCGVYGFVFFRDGEWTYTLVDDFVYAREVNLSLMAAKPHSSVEQRSKAHRAAYLTGSSALLFAKCRSSTHTWLPLLEKAYAKVHGDYEALEGGFGFEGMHDLTGGVASFIRTNSIKDQEELWRQLRRCGDDFLFCIGTLLDRRPDAVEDLPLAHEFAIEGAYEFPRLEGWRVKRTRLLKIRNPWGTKMGLWQGPWSAGCANWSFLATWWLRPQLHENGTFFMTLEDALQTFRHISRLRIMEESKWSILQSWTAVQVHQPLSAFSALEHEEFNTVFFRLRLTKSSPITLALSQLDPRYFAKLQVGCAYVLDLVVRKGGDAQPLDVYKTPIARTCNSANHMRPALHISLDLSLDAGTYEILLQLSVSPDSSPDNPALWTNADLQHELPSRRKKIQQLAHNYDTAFRKLDSVDPRVDMFQVWPLLGCQGVEGLCGVGLRVFSKDEEMELELACRAMEPYEEADADADADAGWERASRQGSQMGRHTADPWNDRNGTISRRGSVRSQKSAAAWSANEDACKVEWQNTEEKLEENAWGPGEPDPAANDGEECPGP